MKDRFFLWAAGGLILVFAGIGISRWVVSNHDGAALEEQLRLARTEGLATNAAEFTATIRTAQPAENAAPLYRALGPVVRPLRNLQDADVALLRHPSPNMLTAARATIRRAKPALIIIDEAASRPRCWFDRDWSYGVATLLPEYGDMKAGSRLLALRGSVAATEGNTAAALDNSRKIFVLSKHAGEEGHAISALIGDAIYMIGLHELANWCVLHPTIRPYREALERALGAQPRPDMRAENRERLWMVLSVIDDSLSKAGRARLGIKEDDLPRRTNFAAMFMSQPKSRIAIVKAERGYRAGLQLPLKRRIGALSDAEDREARALLAFPVAAKMYGELVVEQGIAPYRDAEWEARRLEYRAVLRSLLGGVVARSIKTTDLKSPIDGEPLQFWFDGKQIRIEIHGHDPTQAIRLAIPPDDPRKRTTP